jgi:polar amino acid transport system substrate-binding protein
VVKARVWAAFPYSFTEKRAKKVWFSDVLSCSKTVFFYYDTNNGSKNYHFSRLEDLRPYQIGGVTGYFYEESLKRAGLSVDYVSKEIHAIEKLKIGRIDLMPVNEMVGWDLINRHFPADAHNFKTLPKPLSVEPLRLIVSKDYPGSKRLLERFNKTLKNCIENKIISIKKCE